MLRFADHRAVDDDVDDARRFVGDEPVRARREVPHPAERPGIDRRRIEDGDVGGEAWLQQTAAGDAERRRELAGELVHASFDGQDLALTHERPEQLRRESRIAELRCVRAGVRQADEQTVGLEERVDLRLVVVDDDDAEPRREVLVERGREDRVHRRHLTFGGNVGDGSPA